MELPVKADISDSVNETIMNLSGPTTKTVGQTLGDLVFLCIGGISHEAEKKRLKYAYSLELFKNNLATKVSAIPEEKLIEPDTQKILSALDDAKFCVDHEELRTLFENLIASSLSSDTAGFVHPSFSHIIRRLSVLDAKIIALFAIKFAYPIVEYRITFEDNTYSKNQTNVFIPEVENATYKEKAASLLCLSTHGLLNITYDSYISTEGTYNDFYETTIYNDVNERYAKLKMMMEMIDKYKDVLSLESVTTPNKLESPTKRVKNIDVIKGRCDLTELGFNFLRACGYSLNTK